MLSQFLGGVQRELLVGTVLVGFVPIPLGALFALSCTVVGVLLVWIWVELLGALPLRFACGEFPEIV